MEEYSRGRAYRSNLTPIVVAGMFFGVGLLVVAYNGQRTSVPTSDAVEPSANALVSIPSSWIPASGDTLYTNEPAGMTVLVHMTGAEHPDTLCLSMVTDCTSDDARCPNGCWRTRTDSLSDFTPAEPGDNGFVYNHTHLEGTTLGLHYAGAAAIDDWNDWGVVSATEADTLYIYQSILERGGDSIHGRKIFFVDAERGAASDSSNNTVKAAYFLTRESAAGGNAFMTWQAQNAIGNADDYSSNVSAQRSASFPTTGNFPDRSNIWNQDSWQWRELEVLLIGSGEGTKTGSIKVWINGELVMQSDTMIWSAASPAGCTDGVCGFRGYQHYMNTDQSGSGAAHNFYTGEVYISGKGLHTPGG